MLSALLGQNCKKSFKFLKINKLKEKKIISRKIKNYINFKYVSFILQQVSLPKKDRKKKTYDHLHNNYEI